MSFFKEGTRLKCRRQATFQTSGKIIIRQYFFNIICRLRSKVKLSVLRLELSQKAIPLDEAFGDNSIKANNSLTGFPASCQNRKMCWLLLGMGLLRKMLDVPERVNVPWGLKCLTSMTSGKHCPNSPSREETPKDRELQPKATRKWEAEPSVDSKDC